MWGANRAPGGNAAQRAPHRPLAEKNERGTKQSLNRKLAGANGFRAGAGNYGLAELVVRGNMIFPLF
jgi:hypothetical protein